MASARVCGQASSSELWESTNWKFATDTPTDEAKIGKLSKELAPQVGLEPTTLRLTEALPEIDRVGPRATKVTRISDLRA